MNTNTCEAKSGAICRRSTVSMLLVSSMEKAVSGHLKRRPLGTMVSPTV